jgi:phosphatidylglycerol:prolipoprotein diacylglycerol transferase
MWPSLSIEIGEQTIRLSFYMILVAVGICHMIIGTDSRARKENFPIKDTSKRIYAIFFAILGGGLLSWSITPLFYPEPRTWGPISVMPGIIGSLLVFTAVIRCYRMNAWKNLNLIAPYICFSHGWGRLGCFSAGCCHGQPTSGHLGVHFHSESLAYKNFGDSALHATQLYESGFLFVLGWVLIHKFPPAHRFTHYLIAYGIGRFLLEFIRGDNRGAFFNSTLLSPSQILSLGYIGFGLFLVYRYADTNINEKGRY